MKLRKTLETAVRVGGYAAFGTAGSALAWIAVSSLAVNHRRILRPAMEGVEPVDGLYADTSGSGTPLLLIHSVNAAASSIEMKPLFEHYRGIRPMFALDLPGFGFAARPDRAYTPEVFAEAIAARIGEPVDVVALSLASEFVARAAISHPEYFRSISMISPTGFGGNTMTQSELRRKGLSVPFWSQAFYDLLTSRASIRYFLKKSFTGPVPEELIDYGYDTSHQPGARFAPLYFLSGQLFTENVRQKLYAEIQQPVLVLFDHDGYVGFEHLDEFIAHRLNWASERIGGTSGLPQWEQPEKTIAALDRFWTGTVPRIESALSKG